MVCSESWLQLFSLASDFARLHGNDHTTKIRFGFVVYCILKGVLKDMDQLEPGCAILMHNKVFFSFYLVHIAFEKEQWWPDMFARTFLSLPFCCCNCAGSCPHDGQPKRLGAMESSISCAISSSFPIEGGELSRMLFTGS
jgi:hypothetical protein